MKARWPWFAVWVPVALLLYTLVNGAGHIQVAYVVLGIPQNTLEFSTVLIVASCLYSPWGFLIVPVLAIFAFVSWKLCPQWSPSVRWSAGMVGFLLGVLFLLAQAALLCPRGWKAGMPSARDLRICVTQVWKPHFSRPVLDSFDHRFNSIPSPAWKAQASDFATMLKEPDTRVRGWAAGALFSLGAKECAPDLTTLLKDSDAGRREQAAGILDSLGAKEYVPQIATLLKDPVPGVRQGAAYALDHLGAKAYAPDIATLLKDPDALVRAEAATTLHHLGAKDYVPQIATLLKDPKASVREEAVRSLCALGGKRCVPVIAARLKDGYRDVRHSAAVALGPLTGQHFPDSEAGVRSAQAWGAQHQNDPEWKTQP